MPGVKPFDLLDARSSVLGEVEDVDLRLALDDPHTDRRVAERVDRIFRSVALVQSAALHQRPELALDDFPGSLPVLIVGKKQVVVR